MATATFNTTDGTGWAHQESTGSNTTGLTLTMPTDLGNGYLGLLLFSQDGSTSGATVELGAEPLTQIDKTTNTAIQGYIAYYQEDGTPSSPRTVNDSTPSNEQEVCVLLAISGYNTSTPIKELPTPNTGSDASPICPASTGTATSDDLIIRFICWDGGPDKTLSSGPSTQLANWSNGTSSFGVNYYVSYEWGTGSTVSATSAATLSSADEWIGYTIIVGGAAVGNISIEVPKGPLR